MRLHHLKYFPHPVLVRPDGLLAVGGDLSTDSLIMAYRFGIYPMFTEGSPIFWWAPRDRFVIDTGHMHIPKSMRRYLNNRIFTVTLDRHFDYVIGQCQQIRRRHHNTTWITTQIRQAYTELHRMGLAHSVEVWYGDEIVGGLYGLGIGRIFSGESMFSRVSDSSKFAAIILDQILAQQGYWYLDCQIRTSHMEILGGYDIDQNSYWQVLKKNLFEPLNHTSWNEEWIPEKLQRYI